MYLKVTAGAHQHGGRGDFLIEVHPPLYSDHATAKLGPNAKWSEESQHGDPDTYYLDPDIDWGKELGCSIDFAHMLEFTANRKQVESHENFVPFRYAWWIDDQIGLVAVITTRSMFILGANGKTIDRV